MRIAGVAFGLGLILAFGVWLPRRAQTRKLASEYMTLSARLTEQSDRFSEVSHFETVSLTQTTNALLQVQLAHWVERRDTFVKQGPISQLRPAQDEGRIDFKVALFNARTGLVARAAAHQMHIPPSLGLDETLRTDTRVETALGQLAATVRLVERVMDAGIPRINRIQPLTPRLTSLRHAPRSRLREYPIALELRCDFEQALRLLSDLASIDGGFALERFDLEIQSVEAVTELSLRIVVSAGLPLPRGVRTQATGLDSSPRLAYRTRGRAPEATNEDTPAAFPDSSPSEPNGTFLRPRLGETPRPTIRRNSLSGRANRPR